MDKHSEEVVVVTGAVGNLGTATARAFQSRGYKMVLVDRSPDRLQANFPDLINSPDYLLAGDVDLPRQDSGFLADVLKCFGRLDVLVNTVGAWRAGKPVHEADLSDWDLLFAANVRTTLLACRAVIPTMLKQGRGKIINVASRDALSGSAGYAAYSATKSAVLRLTEALADEAKRANINVNCIMPGTIDTPQNRAAIPSADFTEWVEASALAEVILFLARMRRARSMALLFRYMVKDNFSHL
jgi:NAD(P)-dependent dehydrogenase (short-subunit alcohol dehydrogenase family)